MFNQACHLRYPCKCSNSFPYDISLTALNEIKLTNFHLNILTAWCGDTQAAVSHKTARSLALVVNLKFNAVRNHIINVKRKQRDLRFPDIFAQVSCNDSKSGLIYVDELLSASAHRLLPLVKTKRKCMCYRFIWHKAGVIMVKCDKKPE